MKSAFSKFLTAFPPDKQRVKSEGSHVATPQTMLTESDCEFLNSYGGCSFADGAYRLYTPEMSKKWTPIVANAFYEVRKPRLYAFGSNWHGWQYVLVGTGQDAPRVVLFDVDAHLGLNTTVSLEHFHNEEIVDIPNDAILLEYYGIWLDQGGERPKPHECVGYMKPEFLGGADDESNLELSDMEVHWNVTAQLWWQVKDYPDGTSLGQVNIS